jgi:hypothetical protein
MVSFVILLFSVIDICAAFLFLFACKRNLFLVVVDFCLSGWAVHAACLSLDHGE